MGQAETERKVHLQTNDELLLENLKKIDTFPDGRASLYDLYKKHFELVSIYGWKKQKIYSIDIETKTPGLFVNVPVYAYLSPTEGNESMWVVTGIHGTEPAGPNAVYNRIDKIGAMGQETSMVVIPAANPAGYYRDWRFHNTDVQYGKLNVTDCSHLTPDPKNPSKPKLEKPVHDIAGIFGKYVLKLLKKRAPRLFFDLHEDSMVNRGYVYSQGELAGNDPIAAKVIKILVRNGVRLETTGTTRFPGELIKNGLVTDEQGNRVRDGSIDEFIANNEYFNEQKVLVPKKFAKTSIVPETPSSIESGLTLEQRIKAHEAILDNLTEFYRMA